MQSVLIQFGPLTIHWYGVMMAAGFVAGIANWIMLGRRHGRNSQYCADLMFWIMVAGILGARTAYVLENWSEYAANPLSIVRLDQGGLIFYGGFVAAGVAIVLYARVRRERIVPLMDFVLTSLPLAHALGRIGCFLNGCCFGNCTSRALGVAFPKGSPPWIAHYSAGQIDQFAEVSLPVHPVQLYEAGYNALIYAVLVLVFRRSRYVGSVSIVYLLLYALGRFALEFLRGDRADRLAVGGLSIAQFVSLFVFVVGMVLLGVLSTKRPEHEARDQ